MLSYIKLNLNKQGVKMKMKLKNINTMLFSFFILSSILLIILNPREMTKINSQEMTKNIGKFVKICGNVTHTKDYSGMKIIYAHDKYGKFTGIIYKYETERGMENITRSEYYCFCGEIVLYKGHPEIKIKYLCN